MRGSYATWMFIGILVLLFVCGETSRETFAQRQAVSRAEVTGTFRSYFKGKARRSYNEILIQALGGNKLRVEMELVYRTPLPTMLSSF